MNSDLGISRLSGSGFRVVRRRVQGTVRCFIVAPHVHVLQIPTITPVWLSLNLDLKPLKSAYIPLHHYDPTTPRETLDAEAALGLC